jgi:hypothetical protein
MVLCAANFCNTQALELSDYRRSEFSSLTKLSRFLDMAADIMSITIDG